MSAANDSDNTKCLIQGCPRDACFRGLCRRCHQATRRAIHEGRTTEAELIERKMLLPAARGRLKKKSLWEFHFEAAATTADGRGADSRQADGRTPDRATSRNSRN